MVSTQQRTQRRVRRLAFVAGLGLAAAAVLAWRVPAGGGEVGLDLTLVANLTGELGVTPVGAVLHRRGMRPGGGGARGDLTLTNQTPSPLTVAIRLKPLGSRLERLLRLDVRAGAKRLAHGSMSALRRWSARGLRLAPRERRRLSIRAWLLPSERHSYAGNVLSAELRFRSRALERPRNRP